MTLSRALDAVLAAVVSLTVILIVIVKGDALYLGLWYYFVVPAVLLGLSAALRAKPLFLLGASLAISITLIVYMTVNCARAPGRFAWFGPYLRPRSRSGSAHRRSTATAPYLCWPRLR